MSQSGLLHGLSACLFLFISPHPYLSNRYCFSTVCYKQIYTGDKRVNTLTWTWSSLLLLTWCCWFVALLKSEGSCEKSVEYNENIGKLTPAGHCACTYPTKPCQRGLSANGFFFQSRGGCTGLAVDQKMPCHSSCPLALDKLIQKYKYRKSCVWLEMKREARKVFVNVSGFPAATNVSETTHSGQKY